MPFKADTDFSRNCTEDCTSRGLLSLLVITTNILATGVIFSVLCRAMLELCMYQESIKLRGLLPCDEHRVKGIPFNVFSDLFSVVS